MSSPLRAIVQDELLQVIATAFVALTLFGFVLAADNFLVKMLASTGEAVVCTDPNDPATCSTSMMQAAQTRLGALGGRSSQLLTNMEEVSLNIGNQASRGVFCSFLGVGYTLVNCSPLNAFRGAVTNAAFATSMALADTYAQQFLLSLAQSFSFTFLVPLGLLMRCFKVSRKAGGALVAIGFGFYAVYPTVIMATDSLLHGAAAPDAPPIEDYTAIAGRECDPYETEVAASLADHMRYGSYITNFGLSYGITYFVIVRVLFLSILNLIITLGFIRAFAHVIGSDIDLSGLARIS